MEKYAKMKGYRLNPDEETVMTVLQGLLKNEERYGYRYCPCRPVTGDRQADLPKICPCKWHQEEIRQMGRCLCGLFVSGVDEELERIKERKLKELERRLIERRKSLAEPAILTDATFDRFIREHPAAVVDFWAEWCMPCKLLAPVIEELARRYAGKVAFGKLNVDEHPRTAARFGISAIPILIFFKNGRPVDQVVGVAPRGELESRIARLLR